MRGVELVSEQDAMTTVLENLGEFDNQKHFVRVSQFKLNSYPKELACKEDRKRPWKVGDWIIHFAVSRTM